MAKIRVLDHATGQSFDTNEDDLAVVYAAVKLGTPGNSIAFDASHQVTIQMPRHGILAMSRPLTLDQEFLHISGTDMGMTPATSFSGVMKHGQDHGGF